MGLVTVSCGYTNYKPGGSRYERDECWIALGQSDGAFGVMIVENGLSITEHETSRLEQNGIGEDRIKEYVWNGIKDKRFNYMMLSCNEKLLRTQF